MDSPFLLQSVPLKLLSTDSNTVLSALAPAKLNVFLHVVGKREDDYHLIESVMGFAEDVGDVVTVSLLSSPEITLTIGGRFANVLEQKDPEDNLVVRAARLLKGYYGVEAGVAIYLEKELPIGAGIGGGSSDAATVLKLLCRLWNVAMLPLDLLVSLGADVPVCVYGGTALVRGVGEIVEPYVLADTLYILLVNTGGFLSAGQVYQHQPITFRAELDVDQVDIVIDTENDLQSAAVELDASVGDVIVVLQQQSGCRAARMSGSGVTCFGVFDSVGSLQQAETVLRQHYPDAWVRPTVLAGKVS